MWEAVNQYEQPFRDEEDGIMSGICLVGIPEGATREMKGEELF